LQFLPAGADQVQGDWVLKKKRSANFQESVGWIVRLLGQEVILGRRAGKLLALIRDKGNSKHEAKKTVREF